MSFPDICPGMRLLDHMVILFFSFLGFFFKLFIFGCAGSSLLVVHGLVITEASPVEEHRL